MYSIQFTKSSQGLSDGCIYGWAGHNISEGLYYIGLGMSLQVESENISKIHTMKFKDLVEFNSLQCLIKY